MKSEDFIVYKRRLIYCGYRAKNGYAGYQELLERFHDKRMSCILMKSQSNLLGK